MEPDQEESLNVISASRRTDIPAFYMEWFMNRLRAGYVEWVNPFNGTGRYYSFEKTRVIVFWSKNPRPLMNHLEIWTDPVSGIIFNSH